MPRQNVRGSRCLSGRLLMGNVGQGPRVGCLEIDDYGGVKNPDGDVAAVANRAMGR